MKVLSWNIGNFVWAKYLPGRSHYGFNASDLPSVYALIDQEKPDVIFLQEVPDGKELRLILKHFPDHTYSLAIDVEHEEAKSLFISKYPITEVKHTHSNDYIINGITFFPIHLYAFSPKVRTSQVKRLLLDTPKTCGIILGDTNFWIFRERFLSKRDSQSYKSITREYIDVLAKRGATCRIYLSLDKFFVTKDVLVSEPRIVRHNIGHIDHYAICATIKT